MSTTDITTTNATESITISKAALEILLNQNEALRLRFHRLQRWFALAVGIILAIAWAGAAPICLEHHAMKLFFLIFFALELGPVLGAIAAQVELEEIEKS